MLDIFGADLAVGYDIGCGFETTLNHSPLGEKAREKNHHCLVGAFHGHAHNRLCQSRFLAMYVEGLGLEDLEGCERFFSKSNALAPGSWHASTFHHRKTIVSMPSLLINSKHMQTLVSHCILSLAAPCAYLFS